MLNREVLTGVRKIMIDDVRLSRNEIVLLIN